MKIALVKPDYNIVGGFEIVVERIIKGLEARGHQVALIKVDMAKTRTRLGGLEIPDDVYRANQEFFRHVTSIEEFEKLDLKKYDIVIPTQPPSYAVNHKRVAPLFYHHNKIFYELSQIYIECGIMDAAIHLKATEIIREIDSQYLTSDKHYIAGSGHVASRLRAFNHIEGNIHIFAAGISDEFYNYQGDISYEGPICVGRHEFPKRPELFIHAMKHVDEGVAGRVVGQGGRTESLKAMDRYLTAIHREGKDIDDQELWKKAMFNVERLRYKKRRSTPSNVAFTGRVSFSQLIKEYANAMCVVCPAYEEDYGLTAIEAMAFRKPVIACSDGGGYREFIEDGVNGFVVEPEGEAIADVINYLADNPDKLREMGDNAYEFSRKYSWENALDHLDEILEKIMDSDTGRQV